MKRYPIKLEPITKTALWGGRRLREQYQIKSSLDTVSEAWVLSLRPEDENIITSGEAKGLSLSAYLKGLGDMGADDHFPLLVKMIDAQDKLSVQVHPDDAYAHANGVDSGKTEMWVVLDAEPGASLILGLKEGVSASDFENAVKERDLGAVMREVEVKAGDVFYIPAGLLHAIGAGILIAEIQQNSDTTYRVWDYERRGADGKLRELHIDHAIAVTRPIPDDEIARAQFSLPSSLPGKCLASTPFFSVSQTRGDVTFSVPDDSFLSVLVTSGTGSLAAAGETITLSPADSLLLPRGLGSVEIEGDVTCLISKP